MEARGIEPPPPAAGQVSGSGHPAQSRGQPASQVGQGEDVAASETCTERTEPALPASNPGHSASITEASLEHQVSITPGKAEHTTSPLPPDAMLVLEAWPMIPDPVRAGILAMAQCYRKEVKRGE